jgi:hypothetical protein
VELVLGDALNRQEGQEHADEEVGNPPCPVEKMEQECSGDEAFCKVL